MSYFDEISAALAALSSSDPEVIRQALRQYDVRDVQAVTINEGGGGGGVTPAGTALTALLSQALILNNTPAYIVLSPDGATAYVVNTGDAAVDIVDTATMTLTDSISLGSVTASPGALAISPDGATILVPVADDGSGLAGGLVKIDTATATVTTTIALGALSDPYWAVFDPTDNDVAYVAMDSTNTVSVIDVSAMTVTDTLTDLTANGTQALAITSDGATLYAVNSSGPSTTVSVFDTATGDFVTQIDAVTAIAGIACCLSPDDSTLYVASNEASGKVVVIDTGTNTVTDTLTAGANPSDIIAAGAKIYVANNQGESLSVIDAATLSVSSITFIYVDPAGGGAFFSGNPWGLAATSATIYVTDPNNYGIVPFRSVGLFALPA